MYIIFMLVGDLESVIVHLKYKYLEIVLTGISGIAFARFSASTRIYALARTRQ